MDASLQTLYAVLGDHPRTRILAALLIADAPMNATELIDSGAISNGAFYNNIDCLVESDAVLEARKVGNSQLYTANNSHPVVSALADAVDAVTH